MRQLKNTIYVQTQQSYLYKEGENLMLKADNLPLRRLPIHKLEGLVCFGQITISPYLMEHCALNGITITLLSQYGKFLARIEGKMTGNVFLRKKQYSVADSPEKSLEIARTIVIGKVFNHRAVIRRFIRDHGDKQTTESLEALQQADKKLTIGLYHISQADNLQSLMGYEGENARYYFEVFNHLILNKTFSFNTRQRRPPTDPVNALLSFGYTLMTHDCRHALETTGLDPQYGFFHQLRSGRPSLALDMVEEFRPMVERFILSLINKKQTALNDFEVLGDQAYVLKDDARRTFLSAWQDRKQDKILHPFFEEQVSIGLLPWLQAQILARHLRGDCDAYVPFLWK